MTKKLLFVTTILLAFTLMAFAADVTGKWVYEQPGRGGGNPVQVTLNLKAEGGKLSGNVSRPGRDGAMMESPITDGKVDGNNVTFKTTMQMGGNSMTSEYVGTLEGDAMKLKVTRPGRDGSPMTNEFTAKKSTT
jgi:autotransporter translocation and assembly factor TamB